ncbi:hypothetical protein FOH10_15830 [Nocardia otitidiscaviarum]|uniref:Uncharacterized protein n=1 Tax=Nocardia otitidiscaviarum TaxID=1823 RepID=A0A516NM40_9NOCA|nr:hypothetical protein [Nocardia otitidiscaviarum]MCP9624905.1 hypothetical protein [Nocardia otitidiscaviarum]QDP79955.1 hypothetical protein FOH10_15830 [Nocardia otitidiscaviarum]
MGAHPNGWWILLHLVLFVFWLGGDLGVYYSSRFVIDPRLTPAARSSTLAIMSGLDLGPKICLVLFLPSGVTLMALEPHGASLFGIDFFPWWFVVAVWLFAAVWLALAVIAHRTHGRIAGIHRADLAIRVAVIAGALASGGYALVAAEPFGVTTDPRWLGGKILLYGLAIAAGLGIRMTLRPFGPAFATLMSSGSSEPVERTLRRSVDGCLPYVWTIWGSVLAAAALGVLKPGADL